MSGTRRAKVEIENNWIDGKLAESIESDLFIFDGTKIRLGYLNRNIKSVNEDLFVAYFSEN